MYRMPAHNAMMIAHRPDTAAREEMPKSLLVKKFGCQLGNIHLAIIRLVIPMITIGMMANLDDGLVAVCDGVELEEAEPLSGGATNWFGLPRFFD